MKTAFVVIAVVLLSACSIIASQDRIFSITAEELARLRLAYYSDYFSFVGWDEKGAVAFAIDTNRGQDGDSWQAEHFVVLYDQQSGWRSLQGNGAYDNASRRLERIPDSAYFSFSGDQASGMTVSSAANQLQLKTTPINTVIATAAGLSRYRLGVAAATLEWQGRRLEGRVIHEYLYLPAFNRLTRRYADVFDDFHGIYAVIDKRGDFYFHSQDSDFLAELTGHEEGFVVFNGEVTPLHGFKAGVTRRQQALGFYRLPSAWAGAFEAAGTDYNFVLTLSHRNKIANWVTGGFAMGIVTGELQTGKRRIPLFGLGELII